MIIKIKRLTLSEVESIILRSFGEYIPPLVIKWVYSAVDKVEYTKSLLGCIVYEYEPEELTPCTIHCKDFYECGSTQKYNAEFDPFTCSRLILQK